MTGVLHPLFTFYCRKTVMKKLTEEQQHTLAWIAASETHTSLVESAKERYMSEITSYESVRTGLEKAFEKILKSVYEDLGSNNTTD